jgi:hypothetical protein
MGKIVSNRAGMSAIGTSSPNSSGTANTNSTYGIGAFTTGINVVSGTSYTLQNTDYDGIISFNAASAITLTLNSEVQENFKCSVVNLAAGALTLSPTSGALVNGASSLTLGTNVGCEVFYANGAWTAFAQSTFSPLLPQSIGPVAGEFINSYNSATGFFTLSTPAGLSATLSLAKLTTTGSPGSATFTNGLLTGYSQPT